ncbi:uncharacterized protein LOC126777092 isoform X2 [Nymphalis io]|nr:uncharacterized protein LOC126777092 isoform X2 [Nymphalis io]XP_050355939.1 uncharacterized protein LOC126777092 isoform X2 [Nymphalis io]
MVGLSLLIILYSCHLYIIRVESAVCEANETYKSENITCICNEFGEWPNNQCRVHFKKLNSYKIDCKPGELMFIECNVCRCGENGKVDRDQCTKHECNASKVRRSNVLETRCEPNRWYSFAPCRICYCINEHRLICNNKNEGIKVNLGKYELSECDNLMLDMKELKNEKKPLRYGEKKENFHKKNKKSSIELDENEDESDEESNAKYNQVTTNKAKSKRNKNKSDLSKSDKLRMKKHELSKVTLTDANWEGSKHLSKNQNLRFKLPNVFGNLLNLVLRKSMVSLNSGSNCKPGNTMKLQCNTCFCLTNGKMLCTEKICK